MLCQVNACSITDAGMPRLALIISYSMLLSSLQMENTSVRKLNRSQAKVVTCAVREVKTQHHSASCHCWCQAADVSDLKPRAWQYYRWGRWPLRSCSCIHLSTYGMYSMQSTIGNIQLMFADETSRCQHVCTTVT
jgi:hypothetical protein